MYDDSSIYCVERVILGSNIIAVLAHTGIVATEKGPSMPPMPNVDAAGPITQLVMCMVSCRTAFKWCEFDPRDIQQLFGRPFSKVSLR